MNTKISRILIFTCLMLIPLTFTGCADEDTYDNCAEGNFEALWHIMDEHYCFFDLKQEQLGVNWQEMHDKYAPRVKGANTTQLFEVLTQMIGELRDGHVNLVSSFDYGRNWSWKEDYPDNFYDTLYNNIMGTDYRIAGGISYRILDNNIGYMRIASFASEPGDGNLDDILYYFIACRALIIDVRENGGGQITAAEKIASRFTNEKRLVGYMQHKTGKGHADFSPRQEQWLRPSSRMRWQKQVFVLTDRGVYSAANEFVKYMKECPQCTVIGDYTGGGAGMPFSSELPNGWSVRFSACPMFDAQGNSTEQGIAPDILCHITPDDLSRGIDTILYAAFH